MRESFASPNGMSFITVVKTLCVVLATLVSTLHAQESGEKLVNGNFTQGTANWVLEQTSGASGQIGCVQEAPDEKAALRFKVISISGPSWHLQVYQGGLRTEKGKTYVLTFWAKSDRACDITVSLMQNHAPWQHHPSQKLISLDTQWKLMQILFAAPWNDDNMRICFTDLGTAVDQVYWLANCSLVQASGTLPSMDPVTRLVVWDGEKASKGAGWTNPKSLTIAPQTAEAHSGNTALEFKFQGSGDWLGAGWNWTAFQTGPHGADMTAMKNFTFWVMKKGSVSDLQINLLCNGKVFDMPDHHTAKVSVLKYCPDLYDGQWHYVSIPLADLTRSQGFDPLHVAELQMFNTGSGDGSYFLDDLAFDDAPQNH
jgi:hypothetical protein